jgi:serine/threonine protein kinase
MRIQAELPQNLYEMATGKKAFEGKGQTSLIAKILETNPAPMSSLEPMTPPGLERIVKSCLAKEPDERWQSAADLARELKWIAEAGAEAASQVGALPVNKRVVSRNRTLIYLGFSAAAALVVALGALLLRQALAGARPAELV